MTDFVAYEELDSLPPMRELAALVQSALSPEQLQACAADMQLPIQLESTSRANRQILATQLVGLAQQDALRWDRFVERMSELLQTDSGEALEPADAIERLSLPRATLVCLLHAAEDVREMGAQLNRQFASLQSGLGRSQRIADAGETLYEALCNEFGEEVEVFASPQLEAAGQLVAIGASGRVQLLRLTLEQTGGAQPAGAADEGALSDNVQSILDGSDDADDGPTGLAEVPEETNLDDPIDELQEMLQQQAADEPAPAEELAEEDTDELTSMLDEEPDEPLTTDEMDLPPGLQEDQEASATADDVDNAFDELQSALDAVETDAAGEPDAGSEPDTASEAEEAEEALAALQADETTDDTGAEPTDAVAEDDMEVTDEALDDLLKQPLEEDETDAAEEPADDVSVDETAADAGELPAVAPADEPAEEEVTADDLNQLLAEVETVDHAINPEGQPAAEPVAEPQAPAEETTAVTPEKEPDAPDDEEELPSPLTALTEAPAETTPAPAPEPEASAPVEYPQIFNGERVVLFGGYDKLDKEYQQIIQAFGAEYERHGNASHYSDEQIDEIISQADAIFVLHNALRDVGAVKAIARAQEVGRRCFTHHSVSPKSVGAFLTRLYQEQKI